METKVIEKKLSIESIVLNLKNTINHFSYYVTKRCGVEFDDAKQEILMRMVKAYKKYDNKYSYKTYFVWVINREAMRLIKTYYDYMKKYSFNRGAVQQILIYDYKCSQYYSSEVLTAIEDHQFNYNKEVENESVFNNIKNKLCSRSENILLMLKDGYKLEEIAKKHNTSKQNISNIIRRKIRPVVKSCL